MRRSSIRVRLMTLMICLTTLPVLTVTLVAVNNTRDSVEKEMIEANVSRMLWAEQYLEELIQQIETMFYSLQIDQQLMANLYEIEIANVADQFRIQNQIRQTLTFAFHDYSRKIDEFTLYVHQSQRAYSVNFTGSAVQSLNIDDSLWSRIQIQPIHMYFKQFQDSVYVVHSVNRFEDQRLLGGMSAKINRAVWQEVSDILQSEAESSVFLVNDEGELLAGSTLEENDQELWERLRNDQLTNNALDFQKLDSHFVFRKRIDDGELTVIKAIPVETVAQSAKDTIRAGLLTGFIFAIISILLSILVSIRISQPIIQLARTMRNTSIHRFEMQSVRNRDEIGLLEQGYNLMMQRIKELIEEEYQREIEVKNAQLSSLQAQINPHFLNNTLHLIGGMALSKDAPEIYQITKVVGDLLRYAIREDGDIVTIAEEVKHMEDYLYIQEKRFEGRCQSSIIIDETVLSYKMPKFTLQPLVENAFEHGLQRKEGRWKLEVRIKQIGTRVGIIIRDHGVGMSEEQLRNLRKELRTTPFKHTNLLDKEDSKRKGIGLRNVNTRIKLQYGESFGLRFFSKWGEGTIAVMTIPNRK